MPWETCELKIAGEQGRHYIWEEEKWQMKKREPAGERYEGQGEKRWTKENMEGR